ncbi:MAG: M20/M25/M40 family metallo-hydrolase [Isosphaeraceae bacterium]|nr:M20/M25/M40 family metallo-hydrolase [Isosphaeraceae bacterium]
MKTRKFAGIIALALATLTPGWSAQSRAGAPEPEESRLKSLVTRLASPEFEGRQGQGGEKAADYLVTQFRKLGAGPLFKDSFLQPIPAREPGKVQGRNVGAMVPGASPTLKDEWVIVSAHYDHLGVRRGTLYPGADDNASGVAMMLEVARCLADGTEKPQRSVMFLGFDLEEVGLFGSRYFVEHSPVPLDHVALFITADMIGRSLGGVCDRYVFVMGSEHVPAVRPWIEEAASRHPRLKAGLLGSDLLLLNRSDYGPFRARKVPYLFFSTGENPCYHTPQDVPETIDYPKLESISRVICDVARRATGDVAVPRWSSSPDNPLAEAVTIRDAMKSLYDNRETLQIGPTQVVLMSNTLRTLNAIIDRGAITASERAGVVSVARIILASVL